MVARQFQKLQEICKSLNSWTDKGSGLQQVAALAAEVLQSPLSLITIIDAHNEHYFYNKLDNSVGMEAVQSFCLSLSAGHPMVIVGDTLKDRTAIKNKFVHGRPYIRFFAAVMLKTKEGHELGCLSIADDRPKNLSQKQISILQILAEWIVQIMDFDLDIKLLNNQFLKLQNYTTEELEIELQKIVNNPPGF